MGKRYLLPALPLTLGQADLGAGGWEGVCFLDPSFSFDDSLIVYWFGKVAYFFLFQMKHFNFVSYSNLPAPLWEEDIIVFISVTFYSLFEEVETFLRVLPQFYFFFSV